MDIATIDTTTIIRIHVEGIEFLEIMWYNKLSKLVTKSKNYAYALRIRQYEKNL